MQCMMESFSSHTGPAALCCWQCLVCQVSCSACRQYCAVPETRNASVLQTAAAMVVAQEGAGLRLPPRVHQVGQH